VVPFSLQFSAFAWRRAVENPTASTSIIRDTPGRLRINYQILLDLVTHRLHPSRRAFRRPLPSSKQEKATFLRRTNRDIVTFFSYIAACPPFLQVACKVYYLRISPP
jgi:hypothetical protein